jgi:hypothetical protein
MKRSLAVLSCLFISSTFLFSQSFYFDIGLGFGKATTEIDGNNISDFMDSSVTEIGVELGLKLGYGPIGGIPLYLVGDFSGIGHRFEDNYNYLQFNSYLIGPGIIYYPIPLIQLGTSLGFSFISNQTDLPYIFYDSESGYAGNIYCAIDLGKRKNGCLIGIKYMKTVNTLEVSEVKQETSLFGIFIRYAYRQKN